MLSIEQCRKIDQSLNDLSDEQLAGVLADLYGLGRLALEEWIKEEKEHNKPP